MREVFGLGGGRRRITMPEMRMSATPGYLELGPEQMQRLICDKPIEEYYEVEDQPFARGKYAAVRRCKHRTSGQLFAAKFLRKRRRSADLRPEILHEVAVLEACAGSSRIVRLHQVFESAHEMILLLELASGGELQMLLDRDEVPEERQVKRLMKQILDGLVYLHSINVAHLDIKPQNLVLTSDYPHGEVKLCDLGISRHVGHGADIRDILGTPDYVAPEVLSFEPISLATDMWSVGVLLYVLLTGCSPFGGDTKQETFCNISQCRLDFPEDLFEDISEDAKDLMCKLMVKEPSKRLTAAQCLQHKWFTDCNPETPMISAAPVSVSETSVTIKKLSASISKESNTAAAASSVATSSRKFPTPSSPISKPRVLETISTSSSAISKMISTTVSTIAGNTVTVCRSREVTKVVAETAKPVLSMCGDDNKKSYSVALEKNRLGGMSSFRRKNFMKNMESLAQSYADLSTAVEEENNNTVMVESQSIAATIEPANDNDISEAKVTALDNNNRLPTTSAPSQSSTALKTSTIEAKESKTDNSSYLLSTRNKAIAVQTMPIRTVIEQYNRLESSEPSNGNTREQQDLKNANVLSTEQKGEKSTTLEAISSVQRRTLENRDCVYTFRKCYIIDDSDDEVANAAITPLSHHTSHLLIHHHQNSGSSNHHISYSDHSSSDSGSDTVSEMSIDSSSDRSSIISLDDSLLEYSYSKLGGGRLYPSNTGGYISYSSSSSSLSSHHNVWDTVTTAGRSTMSSRPRYSYNEAFSRAFARFNSVPGENSTGTTREMDRLRKHEVFTSTKKHFAKAAHTSSTVLSSSKLVADPAVSSTDSNTASKKTVDFLRSGNLVVIREVKPVGRYSRVCEVKCESIQSRIRKLQVHQGNISKS